MLDLIARHDHFIKSFRVFLHEQEGKLFRFKAQIVFIDDSILHIKEYIFENQERKYAYHWTNFSEDLICRWDNTNHWTDILTFPHHKHLGDKVIESTEIFLEDVLNRIVKQLNS
ncbi:MAG: DUF6516 family protein [Desulfobacula sp.]|nr:DUF6516 family protein [Desulfobacula sp.]